jgi:hypothetical protein
MKYYPSPGVALPTPRLSRVAGKHHNTRRDEGQQLPEREPDAAKPSPITSMTSRRKNAIRAVRSSFPTSPALPCAPL